MARLTTAPGDRQSSPRGVPRGPPRHQAPTAGLRFAVAQSHPRTSNALRPSVEAGKPFRHSGACVVSEASCELMQPPKSTHISCSRQQTMSLVDGDDPYDLSELVRVGSAGKAAMDAGASSMLSAIGSIICGSNQVLCAVSAPGRASHTTHCGGAAAMGGANTNASGRGLDATMASSSGWCNSCIGATISTTEPTSTSNQSSKRKWLHTKDSKSPSEQCISMASCLLTRSLLIHSPAHKVFDSLPHCIICDQSRPRGREGHADKAPVEEADWGADCAVDPLREEPVTLYQGN